MKTVPTGRLCDTEAEKKAKLVSRSKLRAIDKGTPYDAAGRTVKWARELNSGKMGRVTDIVIVARVIAKDGLAYEHFANGIGNGDTYRCMLERALLRYLA